jgi:phage tail tape-measure protein
MEDEEQGFWGSVTDTLESAADTVSDVVGQAVDNVENMIDTDHDGAVIDDVIRWGVTGAATIGGAVAGIEAGPLGVAGGAALGYAGGSVLGSIGEEVGDFVSDALGTRDELPYGNDGCTDLDYKEGRQGSSNPDGGLGHQLNEYVNE